MKYIKLFEEIVADFKYWPTDIILTKSGKYAEIKQRLLKI
jgi:hypothetical protein